MKIELSEIGDADMAQLFIDGIPFNIEHKGGKIYPQSAPDAVLTFKGEKPVGGYYHAVYNRVHECIRKGLIEDPEMDMKIKLPEILFSGPIRDNNEINEINEKCFRDGAGVVIVNETIRNRLKGILPVVDIAGDKYLLNLNLNQLVLASNPEHIISTEQFLNKDDRLYAWYNKASGQIVNLDSRTLLRTPPHIYLVELPSWLSIDPLSEAWRKDFRTTWLYDKQTLFLNTVMMEPNPTAKSIHISQTEMASVIKSNRIKNNLPPESKLVISSKIPKKGRRH
ncbi:hypothetical protein [[Flexibacter] sp. ATCC 35208]|uniref:hypothetical protein n=1 Tax=[Flexibacter] sp. ATCC 35208 TaxID=1936242 RepID=UPI0009D05066|nr:hypothetical protein [[Flexibacter] sp. ATCC 35208]OMP80043.1 hypothetical protein BW716_06000 [[Flexibacter] sp. ATCC 35208]